MTETFRIRKRDSSQVSEDIEEEGSVEFLINESLPDEDRKRRRKMRETTVTDAGPSANFLDVLIFAASACLWITTFLLIGCTIAASLLFTKSYVYMMKRTRSLAFIILQMITSILEFVASIFTSFCVNYDVESHNVIVVAKLAIGSVCFNVGAFMAVLILGFFGSHASIVELFNNPACEGECAVGVHNIMHLLVGCTYEGIAINVCALPVLVLVLKKAVEFVQMDKEMQREAALVRSHSVSDIHRHKKFPHLRRNVKFSESTSTILESVIPELKAFKTLPREEEKDYTSDLVKAVIQVMSEESVMIDISKGTPDDARKREGNGSSSPNASRQTKLPPTSMDNDDIDDN